jgi:hypothetical protein
VNARHAMRLLAKCAADARECYPSDRDRRAHFFVALLSRELKDLGEPLSAVLAELVKSEPAAA